MDTEQKNIETLFASLKGTLAQSPQGLPVCSPVHGKKLAQLALDTEATLQQKIDAARTAHYAWCALPRSERIAFIEHLSALLKQHRETLAEIITLEAGKTPKEALGEVDGSADILLKTIKDSTLAELNGMLRTKERPPVGLVGLITSFNFPMVVAHWTLAPALLAGNAVLWKPSEKTPLAALACKAIFDQAMGAHAPLLQILVGLRDMGAALVAHEGVDMVSATGSVAMGKAIAKTLAQKKNNAINPILELGGNNGVILSDRLSSAHLDWSLNALLTSFLGTSGQRCTNTRRLFIARAIYDRAVEMLKMKIADFIASGAIASPLSGASNDYGYGPLIDEDAYRRFEKAKQETVAEGGKILFGARLLQTEFPDAYYVEPALALLPSQTALMQEEVFAPLLFIVPYDGSIDEAIALVNAPDNAGLVGAIYTQNQPEADRFAALNEAGHALINSPKGTGTPAHGMGFGGNKASGEGEILNSADPLRAFTRSDKFSRIAQNKDIAMDY